MTLDILKVTFLALADSINPCTIALEAALLSVLVTKSRREALLGGLAFSFTVLVMYFLYGLGLRFAIIQFYDITTLILRILLIILIILEFYAFINYSPGFRSIEMPMKLRPIAKKLITQATSWIVAIPLAVVLSLFLLPCSSGPYLIFLSSMRELNLALMLYYLLLFISPMLLITFVVYFGVKPEKVREFRDRNVRYFHLAAGILLLLVLILTFI